MTVSPFVSFYNSVPALSLDHVLYVHSCSTFPIIFFMHLFFDFFFPVQHCNGRSLDPNDQHWDMHSLRPFHFPTLLLDCTHFDFFFPAQHYIERSLDPNDYHWKMHSLRPFYFLVLLLDCTQCKCFFSSTTLHWEISGSK